MNDKKQPQVGIGVIIRKDNKILLGKRINAHHADVWSVPGGHVEFGETLSDCARREVMEEVGIEIENVVHGPYVEDVFEKEQKHYISIFMIADYKDGLVSVCEPDKCEGWEWRAWDDFPEDISIWLKKIRKDKFNPLS